MALSKESLQERPMTEKPALSPVTLFLSYITDLLFAALVFIGFLLATYGLHYWSDVLGMTSFLFFLRIIALVVISFGTLWCVVFVLKDSIDYVKNLILQLRKPIKQVGGESWCLHPRDIIRRFVEPLSKNNRLWLFVCSGFVFSVLFVSISIAEVIHDNSDDVSILACEMLCETGPDFSKPAANHATMLVKYSKYMKGKHLAGLLRFFSSYSPEKIFSATSENLRYAVGSQEEVANEIWRAGEDIMLFRLKSQKFLPRWIGLHKYRKAPEWLLNDINEALHGSEVALKLFNEKPSLENAVHSCERNRKTMLLIFLVRSNYNSPEVASVFSQFRAVVEVGRDSKIEVAGLLLDDDPRKEFVAMTAEFDRRRIDMLEALKKGDMQKAIDLMWESIEVAYSRREALLKLCGKLRENHWTFSPP